MEKTTQTNEVLNYIKEHDSITSMQAIKMFGATRLADIIWRLRKHGHMIVTHDCVGKNRYGETTTYAKYEYLGFNGLDNTINVVKMRNGVE